MVSIGPDCRDFEEYQNERLSGKSPLEQLLLMDSELANYLVISRYGGPFPRSDLPKLKEAYHERFEEFLDERLDGLIDTRLHDLSEASFGEFREGVVKLNRTLAKRQDTDVATLSESAERLLTKRLRREGFDPSQMDLDHMNRDGALYLLELYATAAQQEVLQDSGLLTELLDALEDYRDKNFDELVESLQYPVLMVSLWGNQEEGLREWIKAGREGVLEMATATGKTVAGIGAIAHLCGVLPNHDFDVWGTSYRTEDATIALVAHSNAILSQWEREIRDLLGLNVSGADHSGRPDALEFATGTVEFHTIQSLLPQYGGVPDKRYDLVICDEAHHYSHTRDGGYGATLQQFDTDAMLGLSATLGEEGSKKRQSLVSLLGDVVYTYSIEDAQRDGIIPEFEWTVHPTKLDPEETEEWDRQTRRIRDTFKHVRNSTETTRYLRELNVPFNRLEDYGDFITAHKAAKVEFDEIPESWQNLHAAIMSRNTIRHSSGPKLDAAIDLASDYLTAEGDGIKVVMFAMDIESTEEIGRRLRRVCDDVYVVHSKVESSGRKKDRTVRRRIDQFKAADNGVLVAPKLLDEGIDVPDAEVGINVAGTKTELQLIQRMGRVLRRHGDKRPHFHHYVAVPDEQHLEGVDGKALAKQLNWVRELGERIEKQPKIEPAAVDPGVVARAQQRGNELWARELVDEEESVETLDGPLNVDEILNSLTVGAIETLLDSVPFEKGSLSGNDWDDAMQEVRARSTLAPSDLQQIWWLYPIYQDDPSELKRLLTTARDAQAESSVAEPDLQTRSESGDKTDGTDVKSESQSDTLQELLASAGVDTSSDESTSQGDDESDTTERVPDNELSDRDLARLHDIARLSPTKNAELCSEWGYDSGSELYRYLGSELDPYFERNANRLIVLTEEGQRIVESTSVPE